MQSDSHPEPAASSSQERVARSPGRLAVPSTVIGWIRGAFLRYIKDGDQAWLLLLALVLGAIMGAVSALFRYLIIVSHHVFFEASQGSGRLLMPIVNTPWLLLLQALLPAIGGLIVGYVIYRVLKLHSGHGVPNVMKAVATGNVNLAPSMAIKSWSSILTLTSGGSVGPEGPIIEIGSVTGSLVGRYGQVARDRVATLIGCGAASGIAAVFGAPIGGVFLALELILRDFAVKAFAPVVLAAVTASVTSEAILPNSSVFTSLPPETIATIEPTVLQITLFAFLGFLCGLVSGLFVYTLYRTHDIFSSIKLPMWIKPAIGGLGVGLVGLAFPTVIGEGYAYVNQSILSGAAQDGSVAEATYATAFVFLAIALVKILSTSLTLGSGGTGGAFAPAMVTGASVGAGFGVYCNIVFPGAVPAVPVFALIGMAGCVGSALNLPIAGMLIIYEVSGGSYRLVLPLMVCVAVSSVISGFLRQGSVYTLSLLRDGFDVEEHMRRKSDPMHVTPVRSVMKRDFIKLRSDDNLERILNVFSQSSDDSFAVVDERDNLVGVISASDLRGLFNLGDIGEAIIAADAADTSPRVLYPESPVGEAIAIFSTSDVTGIPVLSSRTSRRIVGLVSRGDVLQAYRKPGDEKPL